MDIETSPQTPATESGGLPIKRLLKYSTGEQDTPPSKVCFSQIFVIDYKSNSLQITNIGYTEQKKSYFKW
jgi:hypothetical protein